jgi:hypothetical protein
MELEKKMNPPLDGIRRVPLSEILRQHRVRYLLHTSIGDIVMRHITYLDTEETVFAIGEAVNGYLELVKEYDMLMDISKFDAGLNETQMARLIEIDNLLEPYAKLFCLKCFVEPTLVTVEELDAILSNVKTEERDVVLKLMGALSNSSGGEANVDVAVILQSIGVGLPEDLTIETITAEQASAFVNSQKPKEVKK